MGRLKKNKDTTCDGEDSKYQVREIFGCGLSKSVGKDICLMGQQWIKGSIGSILGKGFGN